MSAADNGAARQPSATWEDLVVLEPRLEAVAEEARRRRAMRRGGMNAWYGYGRWSGDGLKSKVSELVGWGRRHEDWDLEYDGPKTEVSGGAACTFFTAADYARWCDRPGGQTDRMLAVKRGESPERQVLWSSDAYDVAYEYVLHLCWACRRKCCTKTAT